MDTKAMEAIREALAKATVGPWAIIKFFDGKTFEVWQSIDNTGVCRIITHEESEANAQLISNAPTWLQQLLDEIEDYEDLKRKFAGLEYANIDNIKELEQLRAENERLQKENERLRGANDDMFQNREKWRESHMQLERENRRLLEVEEDYKALQNIIARARILAMPDEEECQPSYRMDANGNLTRVEQIEGGKKDG